MRRPPLDPLLQTLQTLPMLDRLATPALVVGAAAEREEALAIAWVNQAFLDVTGCNAQEAARSSSWLLRGAEERPLEPPEVRTALQQGRPIASRVAVSREEGAVVTLAWSAYALCDDQGQVSHWLCLQEPARAEADSGEGAKSRASLSAAELRFSAAAETSRDGLYICKPLRTPTGGVIDFAFVYVNAAAVQASGMTGEELLSGSTLLTLFPELAGNGLFEQLIVLLEDGKAIEGEFRVQRQAGEERWLRCMAVRLSDELALTIRDETESRNLESMLRRSQKLESVGRLAAGIAHDFNNFLSSIIGFGSFVRESLPPADPLQDDVQEILSNAHRASKLTRQLLAIGRQQLLAPQVMDLFAVVLNLSGMFRRLLGEGIDLQTRRRSGHGTIKADPGQVEQVLLNLAINARDAMGPHGTLTIECDRIHVGEEEARHHPGIAAGPFVKLSMRDTGHGMTPQILERIFEPFFTTKPAGTGTGLGLPVVYGIVKQSGGFLKVSSTPGKGSTFEVFFPHCNDCTSEIPPPPAETGAHESPRGSELVMVVEDDPSLRSFLSRLLTRNGYGVLEAEDGRQALDVARHSENIALLVTDVMMSRLDGLTLASELRLSFPAIKVVFMSGYAKDDAVERELARPGSVFVQKPLDPQHLLITMRRVLDGAGPITS